jgi:hypothetical protein
MLEMKRTSNERRPKNIKMEDDLKMKKVEYPSNHRLDLHQILNLSSGDQPKSKCLK